MAVEVRIMLTWDGGGTDWGRAGGSLGDAKRVLYLDLSGDYKVYTCQQCIELYMKDLRTLFHVC